MPPRAAQTRADRPNPAPSLVDRGAEPNCFRLRCPDAHDLAVTQYGKHRAEQQPQLPLRVRFAAWFRGWPTRPREPFGWKDLIPNTGRFMMLPMPTAGLLYGGGWVLFGPHQTFRLGGFLALLGGLALAAVIVLYVRRPTTTPARKPPEIGR